MLKRLLGVSAALVILLGVSGCGSDEEPAASDDSSTTDGEPCTYLAGGEAAREVDLPPDQAAYDGDVPVTIETTAGELNATLDAANAPCAVNSFTSLAEQGFFDETPCPRITTDPGFSLLQCGDPTGTTGGGPGYTYPDELTGDETYSAGTLALANSGPDTNGSQFFIVYGDTELSPDYTVFGMIDEADLAIIESIAADGDDGSNQFGGGAPNTPIDITSVTVD